MGIFAPRTAMALGAAAIASALLLTGCSSSATTSSSAAPEAISPSAIDKAMNTPTTITFWTSVPDIQTEVDEFEKAYPKITVKVVNVGNGADYYTKIRSAITAKSGAPDAAQIEYHHIPSFVLGDNLLDLAPYGADKLKDDYVDYAWKLVSQGDAVYGIPQDSGPLGLLYRDDILSKHGIDTPTTWADFETAAKTLHSADPKQYLTNVSPSNGSAFLGLFQQAGANPFGYDGDKTVNINLTSTEGTKVVDYWSKLISSGVVSVDPDFTDTWYQGLASGKYASWVSAAWGPVFLQGTAADTTGKWRATELPQWTAGAHASGNVGGSADVVLKSTKNPIPSAVFAQWLNHDSEPTLSFATKQFLFPTTDKTLASTEFTEQKSPFYGGQQVNKIFAGISSKITGEFGSLPFMDYVYDSFNKTLGKAMADGGSGMDAGLKAWQTDLISYAKSQGFTVTTK